MEISGQRVIEAAERAFDATKSYGGSYIITIIRNIVAQLEDEFDQKMDDLYKELKANGETFEDV